MYLLKSHKSEKEKRSSAEKFTTNKLPTTADKLAIFADSGVSHPHITFADAPAQHDLLRVDHTDSP